MTTLQNSREYQRIDAALRFVARRWWWVRLAQRGLLWLAGSTLLLLVLAGVSGFVNLSATVRLAMLITLLAAPAGAAVLLVVLPLCRRMTTAQAARQIEQKLAGQENRFINAVQLAANGDLFEPELVRRTIDEIARDTSDAPVDRAVTTERLLFSAAAAALVAAALVLFLVLAGDKFAYGLHRLIAHESRSWAGTVRIDEVRPGNVPGAVIKSALLPGDKLTIEALASVPADLNYQPAGRLWIRKQGEADFTPVELKPSQPIARGSIAASTYRTDLVADRSFEYYVGVGDTDQSDNPFRVEVRQLPLVAELAVQPIYPDYLRHQQPKPQSDGDIDAPAGSRASVAVRLNRGGQSIASADVVIAGANAGGDSGGTGAAGLSATVPMTGTADGLSWSGSLPLLRPMQYRLVFRDGSGNTIGCCPSAGGAAGLAAGVSAGNAPTFGRAAKQDAPARAAFFSVTTRPDFPPTVEILRPGATAMVKPGGSIDVIIQARDDHGLTGLKLMVAKVNAPATTGPDQPTSAASFSAGDLAPPQVRNSWSSTDLSGAGDGPAHDKLPADSTDSDKKQSAKSADNPPVKSIKKTVPLPVGDVEGQQLVCWAEASDNRDLTRDAAALGLADGGGPQTARSALVLITVEDPEKIRAMQKQALDQLMAEIAALLKEQTAIQADTFALEKAHGSPSVGIDTTRPESVNPLPLGEGRVRVDGTGATAAAVKKAQSDFLTHLLRLAKGLVVKFDPETEPIQTRLMVLAYNDAALAKALADALAATFPTDYADSSDSNKNQSVKSAESAGNLCRRLTGAQDRIIHALRAMLGLIGLAEKRSDPTATRPDDTNLPPDPRDAWKKLQGDLGEFIKQQARDIDVLQSLAKKPVDDFQRDAVSKDLAANQDKWEKLMDDKISDFSKLAEQDFSNPALLKELIQLKDDVVMAKDALQKKAEEIAVPLEENGLELAKELTTHIEKWLPDTPNRQQWKIEEPVDQKDVPMAELPKELEDMIGDLMEQEEDLFNQIEDATSKWTDSADKGAGWDAADGPISNNSAQGVTGNRLPSNDEISGRSGEGRTGKSNGEMVGDEATGKGGRNTPTRLTNDPFQKGEVKDKSKEPPGGATGGGKVSGIAGEGLQGPVPRDLQQNLQRLADKQAAIRNKAEAVDAQFKANNFTNFGLDRVVTLMRLATEDLSNYRYQNALRKTMVVVNNLQTQKMLLHGDIVVQSDKSPELPAVARKDIRDIDDNDLPPRYKELAKEYLKSLSEETPASAVPTPAAGDASQRH